MSVPRPMRLTTWGVATADATEYVCVGPELTRQMVRRLDHVLAGQTMRERLEDLHDDDPPAYEFYQLRRRGWAPADIAESRGCSVRTVQRALARALRVMEPAGAVEDVEQLGYEDRLRLLRQRHPQAYEVYEMMGYGWAQRQIAAALDVSIDTVKKRSQQARSIMVEPHRQADRERRRQRWLCWESETDVPSEVILAHYEARGEIPPCRLDALLNPWEDRLAAV